MSKTKKKIFDSGPKRKKHLIYYSTKRVTSSCSRFFLFFGFIQKSVTKKKNVTRKLFTTSWKMHTATPKKISRLLSVMSRCCP